MSEWHLRAWKDSKDTNMENVAKQLHDAEAMNSAPTVRVRTSPDPVSNPSHYQLLHGVEVIDVRKALLEKIALKGEPFPSLYAIDCWSRSWEYLTRMWGKNGLEDAKKARVYLDWLIKELEGAEK
jgi:hypothetical protein